jgi:hypothetical protein
MAARLPKIISNKSPELGRRRLTMIRYRDLFQEGGNVGGRGRNWLNFGDEVDGDDFSGRGDRCEEVFLEWGEDCDC